MRESTGRRWTVAGRLCEEAEPLASGVDLLQFLLKVRQPEEGEERDAFLAPSLAHVPDPFRIDGMEPAVDCIAAALRAGERILVHGDYDADGVTATALLTEFLRGLGADCLYFIPDRLGEGYGLSERSAEVVRASGARLVITVDCGVSALDEIAALKASGVSVVVTDHHVCKETLPTADAVIDLKRPDTTYPFTGLSGAGVALRLTQAICMRLGLGDRWEGGIDLAALGTIADIVPLTDENRIWAAIGLERMRRAPRPGVAALLETSNTSLEALDEFIVSFRLAPRLNAAGRMGDASRAVELLLSTVPAAAARLAVELEQENTRRQAVEAGIFEEAAAQAGTYLEGHPQTPASAPLVVAASGWHAGVVGIVAARLTEAFFRPAIVFAEENGQYRGSGRSYGDFDLLAALTDASSETVRYGGHRKAAGVAIEIDRIDAFRAALEAHAAALPVAAGGVGPAVDADALLPSSALTLDNALALRRLAPFGEGNPKPLFITRSVRIQSQKPLAEGRHRRFSFMSDTGVPLPDGIAFGTASRADAFADGDKVDLLYLLEVNEWNRTRRVQLNLRELRPSPPWKVRSALFGAAYRYLKDRGGDEGLVYDASGMSQGIGQVDGGPAPSGFELETVFAILEESTLVAFEPLEAGRRRVRLLPTKEKVSLEGSPTYRRLKQEGALETDA